MTDREVALIVRAALLAIVAAIEKRWDIKRNDIASAFIEVKPAANVSIVRGGN